MKLETQLHEFAGGLTLNPRKALAVETIEIISAHENDKLYISLNNHIGRPSWPVVQIGQRVKKYELIATAQGHVSVAQHAPTSGVIEYVPKLAEAGEDVSKALRQEIILSCDGLHQTVACATPIELPSVNSSRQSDVFEDSLKEKCYQRIAGAGIVGMGGAGFPAHVKLKEGMNAEVTECIINGVECEPLACSDSALINSRIGDLISAAVLMGRMLNAGRTILVVNAKALAEKLLAKASSTGIEVVVAPSRYPAGSEKQLIKIITGKELPLNSLPIHIGVVCFNVATAVAMLDAVAIGKPSVSRVLTLNGVNKTVAEVPIGLPLCRVIEQLDGMSPDIQQVTTGGMMMSRPIDNVTAPVEKTTNEISSNKRNVLTSRQPRACVRCGECVTVCPIKLQPQHLFQLSQQSDLDDLQDYGLFDCIECGCCDYVCPSGIPLVESFRVSKIEINSLAEVDTERASLLQRYQSHLSRQDKATPAERNAALADTSELTSETIDDELAKLKARLSNSMNSKDKD